LVAGEGGFEAIGKTDEEVALIAGGCAGDDADCAARMHEGIVRAADFDEGDNLRAGEDIFGLVGHWVFEEENECAPRVDRSITSRVCFRARRSRQGELKA